MTLLREFCAENMERVPAAIAAGAGRVELCDNLAVGGTSPSYGVIRAAVANAAATGTAVMAMAPHAASVIVYIFFINIRAIKWLEINLDAGRERERIRERETAADGVYGFRVVTFVVGCPQPDVVELCRE